MRSSDFTCVPLRMPPRLPPAWDRATRAAPLRPGCRRRATRPTCRRQAAAVRWREWRALRLGPGAIAGPFLATIADRVRRERAIAAIGFVRGASMGLMAVLVASDAPTAPIYALAVVSTIAGTPFRAAHSALLPSLCETPDQLTSANAVRGMLDSLSTLIGPLAAAVLLAIGTPATVFAAAAAASFWSATLVLRLDYEVPPRPAEAGHPRLFADTREGFRALATRHDLALLIGLGVSQTFTRGAL